ncbi:hypothetical protein E2C01_075100 [Portunus trituberculatus]|uniref:Uncharacterized protein n=1 Tax=Portunus trituberculatus TaxID=210409 RepID=A0A5B7I7L5_PORTR|nr:hypothetical protein [Portunus trituberculatus]
MGGLAVGMPGGRWHPGADTGMESRGHWTRSDYVPDLLPPLLSTREEKEKKEEERMKKRRWLK